MGHQHTKSHDTSNARGHLITFSFPVRFPIFVFWWKGTFWGHFFTVSSLKGHPRGHLITFSLLEVHPKAHLCFLFFFLTRGHQWCYHHQIVLPPLLQFQTIVFIIRVQKQKEKLHTVCASQPLMCVMYFRLLPAVPRRFIRADWDSSVNEDIPSQIHGSLELGWCVGDAYFLTEKRSPINHAALQLMTVKNKCSIRSWEAYGCT